MLTRARAILKVLEDKDANPANALVASALPLFAYGKRENTPSLPLPLKGEGIMPREPLARSSSLPLQGKGWGGGDEKILELLALLRATNPDAMTPKEALELVYQLKKLL